jgi:hypothetical protein
MFKDVYLHETTILHKILCSFVVQEYNHILTISEKKFMVDRHEVLDMHIYNVLINFLAK